MRICSVVASVLVLTGCAGTRPGRIPVDSGRAAEANTSWPDLISVVGDGVRRDSSKPKPEVAPGCGPTCGGCCSSAGACVAGSSPGQCGTAGAACQDCSKLGGACKAGACCYPDCTKKNCGQDDGCGVTCVVGSGCCIPACAGKQCGEDNGCGQFCTPGSGCTDPPPPPPPSPPSCGALLVGSGLPDVGMGCCSQGCLSTQAGGPGETNDCTYCCSSSESGVNVCQ